MRLGLGLRVPARRVAVRTGGGDLVFSRGAAMVACELMDRCGLFRPQKGRQSEGIPCIAAAQRVNEDTLHGPEVGNFRPNIGEVTRRKLARLGAYP